MKAMVLFSPGPVEGEPLQEAELPLPTPGPREIRLRVRTCGICHTDLHTVEGDLPLPKLPVVPGHQVVGVVDAVGEEVTRFAPGQRVGVPWLYSACGVCEFCRSGRENLCRQARFTGLHVDGGYAEAMVVPEAFAYPLPEGLSDAEAAPLLCAGIIGYRALRLSEVRPGERLGMWGFGASAHLTLQVARHLGCEVFVFTRSEEHRHLARELGAVWAGTAQDDPPAPVHAGIIFAPAGWLVREALRVLERGGTLALAGVTMTPIPELDYDRYLYWERTVRSVANFTRQDAEEFLRLAAEIPVRPTVQTFPLDAANGALRALKEGKITGAGVLIVAQ
ncbi:MAG: zinc-dependent alcohol dehydrogenase family protein [Anaerolineae bacterium]|nr:zinc-dependent alcohol dehydrogenase family protein [Anaerolineae bacterium]MCX8068770.1 zinc-dependent alcohol dehydrogenase family protein [Anaerolineae bacterium]MDW7992940.1 zinc-dependent alcohol dehydrogenase family protein [Anaerolineae bacterium]